MLSTTELQVWILLQFGLIFCHGQTQFLTLQQQAKRTNPTNLSARSYPDGAGNAPASISNGYRSSMASDPFMSYPNTDRMYFSLPGAPRPPDPPALGGGGSNMQPFLTNWNYPGLGSSFSPASSGGYGSNNGNNNNYFSGSNNANVGGGYGSSAGYNGQLSGSGAMNYGAQGASSNGYRPQQPSQPGPGSNAYGNVQNGYIVSSAQTNPNQGHGNNYGNSNTGNQYVPQGTTSASVQGSSYGSGGYGSSSVVVVSNAGNAGAYTARRNCRPDTFPNNQGYCTLRNQLKRKCKNLMSSYSTDCSGKELCCFDPSVTVPPPTTTSTATTTKMVTIEFTPSSTTPSNGGDTGGVTTSADRYCIPDSDPSVLDGVCRSNMDVARRCAGIFASTSSNCYSDESCCYNVDSATSNPVTATLPSVTTAVMQTSSTPNTDLTTARTSTVSAIPGCSPGSYAAITNGVCTPASQIAQSCKGKQISPSLDCNRNEYCCFIADSPVGGGFYQPGVTCSPDNNPMVGNGRCVDPSQLTSQCAGMLVSHSGNCQVTQLCCYIPVVTTTKPTVTTAVTTGTTTVMSSPATTATTTTAVTMTTTAKSTTSPAGPACRPGRYPYHLPNGTCVSPSQLSQQCKGLQLDYSLDCDYYQYCCYSHANSIDPYPAAATIAPGSCTPDSNPTINNGFCVNRDSLVARCSTIQASTSTNCDDTQFCCYTMPIASTAQPPPTSIYTSQSSQTVSVTPASTAVTQTTGMTVSTVGQTSYTVPMTTTSSAVTQTTSGSTTLSTTGQTCHPQNYPSVSGKCVGISVMSSQCVGMQAVPSLDCGPSQFCCFISSILNTPPSTGSKACIPDNNPTITTGACVDGSQINTVCDGKEMSTSEGCVLGQFCCYTISGGGGHVDVTTTGMTTLTTGSTVVSTTPIYAASTAQSSTAAVTIQYSTNQQTTSGLINVTMNPFSSTAMASSTCSPQGYPNIRNGACVSLFNLATQCEGIQASPSLNCGTYEYCCFNSSTTPVGTSNNASSGSCSPDNNPAITNGICVQTGQLTAQCGGNDISASPQCSLDQYCCYSPNGGQITTPATVTGTQTVATSGTVVTTSPQTTPTSTTTTPVTTQTSITSTTTQGGYMNGNSGDSGMPSGADMVYGSVGYGYGSVNPFPSGNCSPLTAPDVTNGLCVDLGQLAAKCQGGRVAKSNQCLPYEYCCFGAATPISTTVIPPPSTTTSAQNTTGGKCTPLTAPDVTNGVCADVSQLSTVCMGLRVAKSQQCALYQYCCFGGSQSSTGATVASTSPSTVQVLTTTVQSTTAATTGPAQTTTATQYPVSGSSNSGSMCSPSTAPSVKNGVCVGLGQISSKCSGQRISKSTDCQSTDYCCFTSSDSGQGNTCTPSTAPSISNGICTDLNQLSTNCRGMVFSKSSGCQQSQFCCFTNPTSVNSTTGPVNPQSGTVCSPSSQPSISNGMCVPTSQLSSKCRGSTFSKSVNCSSDSFCCFASSGYGNMQSGDSWSLPNTNDGGYGGSSCSPNTEPSISNGICVTSDKLSTQCTGMRLSKSADCPSSQFCCFSGAVAGQNGSGGSTGASNQCTPNSQPSINNGLCVDTEQLSAQCKKLTFSKSTNCKSSQFCCFNISGGTSVTGTTPLSATTTSPSVTSSTSSTGGSGTTCSPNSQPSINNGKCFNTDQLSSQCRQLTFSKSAGCAPTQFCCFSSSNMSVTPSPGGSVSCSPSSAPQVTNGVCTNTNMLTAQCQGQRISKSPNCGSGQYCCFSAAGISYNNSNHGGGSDSANGNTCIPSSAPSIMNGKCVNNGDLAAQCPGQRMSKSPSCATGQFCCFTDGTAQQGSGVLGCSPQSEPTVTNGTCVNQDQLAAQCGAIRFSKSLSCQPDQYCCFGGQIANNPSYSVSTTDGSVGPGSANITCSPSTAPSVTNGRCVSTSQLSSQCAGQRLSKSSDCQSGQYCCFSAVPSGSGGTQVSPTGGPCTPETDPSTSNGVCVEQDQLTSKCSGQRMSKSPNCISTQYCCFNASSSGSGGTSGPSTGGTCTPNTDPSTTNGLCVDQSQLTAKCAGQRMSKSPNCPSSQYCCFSPGSGGGSTVNISCTPLSNPSVNNGVCLDLSALNSQCQGKLLAKSMNCQSSQFCCFSNPVTPSPTDTTNPCTPQTEPSVTNGTCVDVSQLTSQCQNLRFSKSTNCGSSQFCCFSVPVNSPQNQCTPETEPTITNGVCLVSSDLPSRCNGGTMRAAKSINCLSSQWCCFNGVPNNAGQPAALLTGSAFSQSSTGNGEEMFRNISMLSGNVKIQVGSSSSSSNVDIQPSSSQSCSPNSDSSATNGICMKTRDLQVNCIDQRASPSVDCPRFSWCCFGFANATMTTSSPAVTSTEAVALVNPIRLEVLIPNQSVDAANKFTAVRLPNATRPSCTPNVDNSVHDGQCMRMREISESCVDRRASPSADCPIGQWCCFGESVVALTGEAEVPATTTEAPGQCAPNNNPTRRNGVCQTIRELQSQCVEKQAAPSADCEMGRWCCYTEPTEDSKNKVAGDVVLEVTTPETVSTTVAQSAAAGTSCTPNAEPSIDSGICMPTKDLRARCRNRRVSKSPQCRMGQWCCFTDPQQAKSAAAASDFSPLGRSELGAF